MSKKALQYIIDCKNTYRLSNPIDINNITDADATELYEYIDGGLSPENLHCDGEITPAQATVKFNTYIQTIGELKRRGFDVPEDCWEINGNY